MTKTVEYGTVAQQHRNRDVLDKIYYALTCDEIDYERTNQAKEEGDDMQ